MAVHIDVRQTVEDALGEIDYNWCDQYREAIVSSICAHIEVTAADIDPELLEEGETAEGSALDLFMANDWQAEVERATLEVQEFALSVEWHCPVARDVFQTLTDDAVFEGDGDCFFPLALVDHDHCRTEDDVRDAIVRCGIEDYRARVPEQYIDAIAKMLVKYYYHCDWFSAYARDAHDGAKSGDFDCMMNNLDELWPIEMQMGDRPITRDILNRLFPAN